MGYFEIKGVLPPMITPFQQDGKVDYSKFAANIEKWNAADLAGYLVLGSNSETPFLSDSEKEELMRLTVRHAEKGRIIMAGTGLESTEATIALTNMAADLGVHCALLLTPNYYNKDMGDAAQIAYFTEVADNTRIPVLIYNVTKFTHINISPQAVSTLSRHPNIIGMKDSSGDIAQLIRFMDAGLDEEFNLMVGTASAWYPALCVGVKGAVMALANCCPNECTQIQRLYDAGKPQQALELYKRVFPVNDAVTAQFGVPGLKHACDRLGYMGGYTRKPLLGLSEAHMEKVGAILRRAALL